MTKEEFGVLAKGMKAMYTYENFLADDYSKEMWYVLLKDLPYNAAAMALKAHMQTSSRVPTPADIRTGAVRLARPEALTDGEAWALVSRAISNSGYHSQTEFDSLPEMVRKAVGSARQLYIWSQTDIGSVETVIQSQFLRSYRQAVAREERKETISPDVRMVIEETAKQLPGG